MNRLSPPPAKLDFYISIPYPEVSIKDDFSFYFYSYGNFPNVSIAIFYPIGSFHLPLVNFVSSMLSLLLHGSQKHPYPLFKKELQRLGSSVSHFISHRASGFIVNGISIKGLEHALNLLTEAIEQPEFKEDLILSQKKNALQQLEIQMKNPTWQASRFFRHHLFGPNHPLGHQSLQDEIELLNPTLIEEEWKDWKQIFPYQILAVSNFSRNEIESLVKKYFSFQRRQIQDKEWPIVSQKGYFYVPVEGDLTQASIRIGKIFPGYSHPDYYPLRFVVIALGGFFGSRLMQRVREEEGLTYGIDAQYNALANLGSLVISSDTSNPKRLLSLVQEEIENLHTKPFTQAELEQVKNYIKGTMLSLYDSPQSIFSFLFSYLLNQRPIETAEKWLQFLDEVTYEQLEEVIHKYFDWKSFLIVHAGKKD